MTLCLSPDCTEATESLGHTFEEKAETVKCYSTFYESMNNGTDNSEAKAMPYKDVTEMTTESHICESGAC